MLLGVSTAGNKSLAIFSFINSNVRLKGPSENNFKGNVSLDLEGKGIVLTANDGGQNEGLLKLVSEKIDSESYLIDYRLMRSCDLNARLKDKKNLLINFSPFSLENRKKNDKFNIEVEILNYTNFIPNDKYKTEADIREFLKSQCTNRKQSIKYLKEKFVAAVSNYHLKAKKLNDLQFKMRIESKEYENIKNSIKDTETQIKDITNLQNSYEMQLKSISNITSGAFKLIANEKEKKDEIIKKQNDMARKIDEKTENIKKSEEKLILLRDKYSKSMENSKEIENLIINYQKDLSEANDKISDANSNKLRLEFDLKNAYALKQTNEKTIKEMDKEIINLKKKMNDNNSKINKL
jgi:DNA repair exonuclease SbcCD ATPase subunit